MGATFHAFCLWRGRHSALSVMCCFVLCPSPTYSPCWWCSAKHHQGSTKLVQIQWAVLTGSRLTANADTQGKSCTEMAHALLPHATPGGCIKQHKHMHCICLAAEAITNHPTLYNHEICGKHSVCCILRKENWKILWKNIGKLKKKNWNLSLL